MKFWLIVFLFSSEGEFLEKSSYEASALTNRAARMIETLHRELLSAERELGRHGL